MNEVTIVGNLVERPRLRIVGEQQNAVANFRLAHNRRVPGPNPGEWIDRGTVFVDVVCWRNLAENVDASLGKGISVIVSGRLHSRHWEDKDGRRHEVLEIEATSVGVNLARYAVSIAPRRSEAVARQEERAMADVVAAVEANPWDGDTAAA
jgi:single-strand DNA-binding protein